MVFPNQLTLFAGILLKISTFLSLVNKDLPIKNSVSTTNIHYVWKNTDCVGVIL